MSAMVWADIDPGAVLRGSGAVGGWSGDLAAILAAAGVLLFVNTAGYLAWRWLRRDGLERAFLVCAARGRLARPARRAVRDAAAMIGKPPVTLVISEHAFNEGQRAMLAAGAAAETVAALSQARQKLFA